jgi:hypothetical protein
MKGSGGKREEGSLDKKLSSRIGVTVVLLSSGEPVRKASGGMRSKAEGGRETAEVRSSPSIAPGEASVASGGNIV